MTQAKLRGLELDLLTELQASGPQLPLGHQEAHRRLVPAANGDDSPPATPTGARLASKVQQIEALRAQLL